MKGKNVYEQTSDVSFDCFEALDAKDLARQGDKSFDP